MEDIEDALRQSLSPVIPFIPKPTNASAAVMILFVKLFDKWNIVYTRRTNDVSTHQGEVSFPGGVYEQSDNSLFQTALRETREEIGIDPSCIRILGAMTPYNTHYGLEIHPFVGILTCKADFIINESEVRRVFLIPVEWLKDEGNPHEQEYVVNEQIRRQVIHYEDYDGEHVWGITARITKDLLEKI